MRSRSGSSEDATDPFRQINEYVGSGPMRSVRNEWVPGATAVFEKFAGYVPRQEPASWLAGGKRMMLDRIEWIVIADPESLSIGVSVQNPAGLTNAVQSAFRRAFDPERMPHVPRAQRREASPCRAIAREA